MLILPVDAPLHPGLVNTAAVPVILSAAVGSVITTDNVAAQLFASVTLTV
jgi:hypothetical protein